MYGVPPALPLQPFVGKEFNQVALGRFQIQLHSSGTGSIDVDGRWEVRNAEGGIVDAWAEPDERQSYRIHTIIDVPIVGYEIDAPRSFTIVFENGHRLTVFDDNPQYEAFSLHLDGQPSTHV